MIKHWLFKLYGWISLTAAFAVLVWVANDEKNWLQIVTAAGAAILGFCYFVQQQKLAETELFHQLFTAFNARYDHLNGQLSAILAQGVAVEPADRMTVVDYFNLCAEEYLFYKEGYIHPKVWTAWCRGMLWYLRRHPFKDVWHEEVQTDSFYGLTLDEIQRGAKL